HGLDAAERAEIADRQVGPDLLVSPADVVADPARRHVALVGDAAADRLAVARVVVGAQDAVVGVARGHAALELVEAALIHVAERLDLAHRALLSIVVEDTGRDRTAVTRFAAACLTARPRCRESLNRNDARRLGAMGACDARTQ